MNKIVLIGFAACYKTSVGRLLAEKLNWQFVDTDAEIERQSQCGIQQIFEQYGEQTFRQMEDQALLSCVDLRNTVVACGGGSVLCANFTQLVKDSVVVALTANLQSVASRLGQTGRPLFDKLTEQQLHEFMKMRAPLYGKYACVTFSTDNFTSQQVAEQVYTWSVEHM